MQADMQIVNSNGNSGNGDDDLRASLRVAIEVQNIRIGRLEKMIADHNASCANNAKDIQELVELMKTIKQGMKITNAVRNVVVWLAGLIAAGAALYHQFKG